MNEEFYSKKKRNIWLALLASLFLLAGLIWLVYWLLVGRFYVYTENAYVHGNEVVLTPQVAAGVKTIYADETDFVERGQLVVELESLDFELRFEVLKKRLSNTVKEVGSLFQQVKVKEAQVALRAAELKQAELDFQHREPLRKTGAVSKEDEIYQMNVLVGASSLVVAERELGAAQSLVAGTTVETHPRVQEAASSLRQAYLDLIRCQIWAPVSGFIAKRAVQVGDKVSVGQTLLLIVPLDYIWLEANYKETQLTDVRIGQPVSFTADIYGGEIEYHGRVIGFQPGSGNAFALLPPENASGNWIKIIQRVPVRISIDPDEIKAHPLLLGLSARATVDIHDTSGAMLAVCPTKGPLFSTSIYYQQLEEMIAVESIIQEVIRSSQ